MLFSSKHDDEMFAIWDSEDRQKRIEEEKKKEEEERIRKEEEEERRLEEEKKEEERRKEEEDIKKRKIKRIRSLHLDKYTGKYIQPDHRRLDKQTGRYLDEDEADCAATENAVKIDKFTGEVF